jgi:hypothetical protein
VWLADAGMQGLRDTFDKSVRSAKQKLADLGVFQGNTDGSSKQSQQRDRILDQDADGNVLISAEQLLRNVMSSGDDILYEFDVTHCTLNEIDAERLMHEFSTSMAPGLNDQMFADMFRSSRRRRTPRQVDLTADVGGSYDYGWLKQKIQEYKAKQEDNAEKERQNQNIDYETWQQTTTSDTYKEDCESRRTSKTKERAQTGPDGGRVIDAEYEV